MFARAAAAATLALLIGGDVARLGWAAVSPWHVLFPFCWFFILLETVRRRRRIEDGEAFLAGAAMALLYGGVYAKNLQYGTHPLGVDWLGALEACFDGGMTAVLALHVLDRLWPRQDIEPGRSEVFVPAFLLFVLGGAVCVYGIKTVFSFYQAERQLGPTWLLADLIFAAAAGLLILRIKARFSQSSASDREPWIFGLAAFAVWLPGARLVARACVAADFSDAPLYFFVGIWTVIAGGMVWRLWRQRGRADSPLSAGRRATFAAAVWRAVGACLLALVFGSVQNDARAAGVFSAVIDLPTRALFAWFFLTTRLKI